MDQLEKKRKRFLDIDDIVGQEMSSVSRTESTFDDFDLKGKRSASAKPDGENKIKIEAFNMRDDLEEGNFDATGTFVWNKKDPQAYQDEWLSSVSKGAIERARESKDKQKQKQSAQTDKLALRWDTVSNEDLVLAIINMLEPRETVFAALARIGGSGAKQKKKKVNKWSKKGRAQMDTVDDEKERERKRLIERLTELADQAMARGISGIYDDSYEQMVRQMRVADRIPDDWMPGTLLPTTAQDEPMSTGSDPEGGLLDDIL
ncbi:hypothetical protein GGF43_000663 [Coemansia sp. RSA 2618]|nr:hypothetical protein GGF43_000663 [Coemansia sp. RSA 2618]